MKALLAYSYMLIVAYVKMRTRMNEQMKRVFEGPHRILLSGDSLSAIIDTENRTASS